jgi:hypothetical protein
MADPQEQNTIAEGAVATAAKQLDAGELFKQPRMQKIKLIDDMYGMKEKPALVGMYNIPFDGLVLRGYTDTLLSKIDDTTKLVWKPTKGGSLKASKKMNAAWERESASDRSNWPMKDRWAKKLAINSGRGTFVLYPELDPQADQPFKFCIDNADHYDLVVEPNGGGHLEKHLFKYQKNVFKTEADLRNGARLGYYNGGQVSKLLNATSETDFKQSSDDYKNKVSRFASVGLDAENNNYVGQRLFNLVQGELYYKGQWYYILFDSRSKIWIRFVTRKENLGADISMFVSWSTDDDPFNFWNLGPSDVIYPAADAMRLNLNGMLNNMRKKIDAMIAYDPEVVTDPSQLVYRPNGLISAILSKRPGLSLADVVHYLPTENVAELAVNITQYLNNFLGEQSGITPAAKGAGNEDKVNIYFGNLQQIADRIGRLNKSYTLAVEEIGRRFDWSIWKYAPKDYMVQIIGSKGAEWEQLTKEDTDPDYEIVAVSTRQEMQASEVKKQNQKDALALIQQDPTLTATVSPRWRAENILKFGGWEDEDVKVAMNTQDQGNQEVHAEAERMIELVLEKKKIPRLYRGANTAFYKHIVDFAYDHDLTDQEFNALIALADAHKPFIEMNVVRQAQEDARAQMNAPITPGQPTQPVKPLPQPSNPLTSPEERAQQFPVNG